MELVFSWAAFFEVFLGDVLSRSRAFSSGFHMDAMKLGPLLLWPVHLQLRNIGNLWSGSCF